MKAVFLDRDGIINIERGDYTYKLADFRFVPGIFDILKKLADHGFTLIVITNQGGIAKGLFNHEELKMIHQHMLDEMNKRGVEIKEIYYCPHHREYEKCLCRKPMPLMLEKAVARFGIAKENAFFIGDHERDYEAGIRSGIKSYQVEANKPIDAVCDEIISQC